MTAASLISARARNAIGRADHEANACSAAWNARSMCAAPAIAVRPTTVSGAQGSVETSMASVSMRSPPIHSG